MRSSRDAPRPVAFLFALGAGLLALYAAGCLVLVEWLDGRVKGAGIPGQAEILEGAARQIGTMLILCFGLPGAVALLAGFARLLVSKRLRKLNDRAAVTARKKAENYLRTMREGPPASEKQA